MRIATAWTFHLHKIFSGVRRWSEPTIIQSGPGPPVDTFPPTEKSSSLESNVWSFGSIFKSPILGFYAFHPIPKVQTAKLPFITSIPDFFRSSTSQRLLMIYLMTNPGNPWLCHGLGSPKNQLNLTERGAGTQISDTGQIINHITADRRVDGCKRHTHIESTGEFVHWGLAWSAPQSLLTRKSHARFVSSAS